MSAEVRVRNLVFDIHGVLLGRTEPAGRMAAGPVLDKLRGRGYRIRFVTNTSSTSPEALAKSLVAEGIDATPDEVFTAATTVGTYLGAGTVRRNLFVVGSDQLRTEITRIASDTVRLCGPAEADVVVVTRDPDLTEETLDLLRGNRTAQLIATCRDGRFASGAGLAQGPGPTVERVERALGRTAQILGKPNQYVLRAVMRLTPQDIAETVVIGDSIEQDVMLARSAGARWFLLAEPETAAPPSGTGTGQLINALDEMLELLP